MARRESDRAREYLGTETGALVRDWGGRIPIALVFPNSYSVGMSSLAIHTLYEQLNAQPGLLAERAFAWLERPGAEPPLLLESQRPLSDAAVIAVSLSFEMDYFNLIEMLRQAGIAPRASERGAADPLVLLGGPAVSANPAPLAPLADAIVIGEIEPIMGRLAAVLRGLWDASRAETLSALAALPGVYVPAVAPDGPVAWQRLRDLDAIATQTAIISPRAEFGDMHLIELSRGCVHSCRFCLAGAVYRPYRERSLNTLIETSREALRHHSKLGLVAAAVSDYSRIDELASALSEMGASISVSSMRVRPLPESLIAALEASGSRSVTIAPEAGSQRLRDYIRKDVDRDDVLRAVDRLEGHFASVKLYSMIGLPTETRDDIEELLALTAEVKARFSREVVLNVTPFVPKAHTPFERTAMEAETVLDARIARLREGCRSLRVGLRAESVAAARIQGVLARGDARVGEALLSMPHPTPRALPRALRAAGIDMDEELGQREPAARLPWEMIQLRGSVSPTVQCPEDAP